MLRTTLLFAALALTACGLPPEGEEDALSTSAQSLATSKACTSGRVTLASGTVVVAGRGRAVCTNGVWGPMTFTATPPTAKYDCGKYGCNCWGDEDCDKLTQSGDCNGKPIKCDPNNPNACHCE